MMTNTYLPHVGGVARSVSTFAEEYRKRKHRVLVVAPEFQGKALPARAAAIVERVPAIQKFNGSDFSVKLPLLTGLTPRLDAFRADIVHAHHPFLLGDTALRVAANKNVPVIFTHHTRYEDYTHYVPFDSPALKEVAINISTHFANLCDAVIAPSESIARLIRRRGVEVPIRVVPTGIDTEAFASGDGGRFRAKFKLPPDAFVVGHVGRLAPEKNLEFLAEAVAQFLHRSPDAWFLVVGAGPSEETLKQVLGQHGVLDRLVLAGKQTGRSLADAYNAMDLFAFASFSETQGMVLAEAMAAGLPVIALNASGVREVMDDGKNGFMLEKTASPRRFAAQLARLQRHDDMRSAFGEEARRTAELFSRERCAELALTYYEDVRRMTRRERLMIERSPWGTLLERVSVEWNLLAEKAQAVAQAMGGR
ncbi:glycosyl transferase group 1 [Opitutus terrae PB90-1]|uniref:Glycosyl transferase group 1 n=2 Tax=Opitutus terrae TaxID=107709 RepID=B1ZVI1_OPITP|nr:glycosyl transferase group 1 [Opitutus terrae PB90-1]